MYRKRSPHGFTIVELLVVIVAGLLLLSVVVPALAQNRNTSGITRSLANLMTLGHAHRAYAAEWDFRQMSMTVYDLTEFESFSEYEWIYGKKYPDLILGWGPGPDESDREALWYYDPILSGSFIGWPINPIHRFGWFRVPNFQALHKYVNGKFYDPVYYAPNDVAAYTAASALFDEPYEFVGDANPPYWSSYCLSPAALFNPSVLRRADPSLCGMIPCMPDDGFETPAISQARYPSLKTQMIEHNWVQNPPAECNPAFFGGYDGCEPYYFNHGLASSPAALFYDGSVRLLPNKEAVVADKMVTRTAGDGMGLWFSPGDKGFSEAGELALDGYWISAGFDKLDIGHRILTIDGILGRDTLGQ